MAERKMALSKRKRHQRRSASAKASKSGGRQHNNQSVAIEIIKQHQAACGSNVAANESMTMAPYTVVRDDSLHDDCDDELA